jgi:NADPH:quinone reductase-like Zn-dependent oxidoreductase
MSLARRIASAVVIVMAVGLVILGLTMSHDSECVSAPAEAASTAARMKAVLYRCYGPPEVLKVEEVAKPSIGDHQILVKVRAASINPLEWHYMRGTPYLMRFEVGLGRPKDPRIGVDFAGTVEAVGGSVTRFHPGDEVFGGRDGALAEYVAVRDDRAVVLKPANVSFEQAAAVPVAAVTALQALREESGVRPGQKVLINGASGGVGTFAVQIAKSLGAEVTAVCSTRNVSLVRSLGADHVVDYTREDFTQGGQLYDVVLDAVGNRPLLSYRPIMKPHAVFVMVGGPSTNPWLGPLVMPLKALMVRPFVSQKFDFMLADINKERLTALEELMQAGKLVSVVDRTYPLTEISQAVRYLEAGHARGKVVIRME